MTKTRLLFLFIFCISIISISRAQLSTDAPQEISKRRIITMSEFVQLATANDTVFESILIDELPLQYRKDLNLPARDVVLEVKEQYDFFLNQNREEPDTTVSLSKLFPHLGTELEAAYKSTPSFSSTINSSEFTATLTQPIAQNAFGKATRLRDKIIGVEIDVIKHQIIEAYEDYLAATMTAYLDWYEAYENLQIGKSSYAENLKLMDNIKGRQKSSIALPIDVNKIRLQVLAKKEKLVSLEQMYQNALNIVSQAMRYSGQEDIIPTKPQIHDELSVSFDTDYAQFKRESRTYQILELLENKSLLEVNKNANDLLPSIDLLIGYKVSGDDHDLRNEDEMAFAALSMEWPLSDQVERAEYQTATITLDKQKLTAQNTYFKLYTDIKNLFQIINRETQLEKIAEEKTDLAKSVLEDETQNYSFGKVTINDYIQAVNVLDNNRFNHVLHDVQRRKLMIEWLRITDSLIHRQGIKMKE